MNGTPRKILEHYWGYPAFRGSQELVVDTALQGRDVLALMPTGGGKSVCFQVPALAMEGICIVVSPLVALIEDQVTRLRSQGIKSIALSGAIPYHELDTLLDNAIYGNYKFLYLSPERLGQELVRQRIRDMPVNLIAVDEAHCISQWGHDFRPAYLQCHTLRELHPHVPVMALTATATPKVTSDIVEHLVLSDPLEVKDSFARNNIAFLVLSEPDKRYALLRECQAVGVQSVIIYVRTRRLTRELAQFLQERGVTSSFFHGGMSPREKKETLNNWLSNTVRVIVATNAFGMGIDKPDVALVVHYQVPNCIENYYQEAGRAGRNGKPAKAVLFTDPGDREQVKRQFLDTLPNVKQVQEVYRKLNNYFQIPYGELPETSLNFDFNAFCGTYTLPPAITYNALQIMDQQSVLALSESFSKTVTIRFLAGKERLFDYLDNHRNMVPIVQTILRTYGGLFDFDTTIDTWAIAKKIGSSETAITAVLEKLHHEEIIDYRAKTGDLEITFLVPREDDATIYAISDHIKDVHRRRMDQLSAMLAYVDNTKTCRSRQLLGYFGESVVDDCKKCDVCLSKKTRTVDESQTIREALLEKLRKRPFSSRELIENLPFDAKLILEVLRYLLEDGTITITSKNEYLLENP